MVDLVLIGDISNCSQQIATNPYERQNMIQEIKGERLKKEEEIREIKEGIEKKERDIEKKEQELRKIKGEIREKEGEIRVECDDKNRSDVLQDLRSSLQHLRSSLHFLQEERKFLVEEIKTLRQSIANLESQISSLLPSPSGQFLFCWGVIVVTVVVFSSVCWCVGVLLLKIEKGMLFDLTPQICQRWVRVAQGM